MSARYTHTHERHTTFTNTIITLGALISNIVQFLLTIFNDSPRSIHKPETARKITFCFRFPTPEINQNDFFYHFQSPINPSIWLETIRNAETRSAFLNVILHVSKRKMHLNGLAYMRVQAPSWPSAMQFLLKYWLCIFAIHCTEHWLIYMHRVCVCVLFMPHIYFLTFAFVFIHVCIFITVFKIYAHIYTLISK